MAVFKGFPSVMRFVSVEALVSPALVFADSVVAAGPIDGRALVSDWVASDALEPPLPEAGTGEASVHPGRTAMTRKQIKRQAARRKEPECGCGGRRWGGTCVEQPFL